LDPDESERYWIVRILYYDAGGGRLGYENVALGGPGSLTPAWQQVGGRVTTPAGTSTVRIMLLNYMNSGWVAFDDVSMTPGRLDGLSRVHISGRRPRTAGSMPT